MAKAERPTVNRGGRPKDSSKTPVWCRIDTAAIGALDAMAGSMDPQPSRAQLIDRAVREFVERNRAKGK